VSGWQQALDQWSRLGAVQRHLRGVGPVSRAVAQNEQVSGRCWGAPHHRHRVWSHLWQVEVGYGPDSWRNGGVQVTGELSRMSKSHDEWKVVMKKQLPLLWRWQTSHLVMNGGSPGWFNRLFIIQMRKLALGTILMEKVRVRANDNHVEAMI